MCVCTYLSKFSMIWLCAYCQQGDTPISLMSWNWTKGCIFRIHQTLEHEPVGIETQIAQKISHKIIVWTRKTCKTIQSSSFSCTLWAMACPSHALRPACATLRGAGVESLRRDTKGAAAERMPLGANMGIAWGRELHYPIYWELFQSTTRIFTSQLV